MLAAGHIAKDPAGYGFTNVRYQQPMRHEEFRVPGVGRTHPDRAPRRSAAGRIPRIRAARVVLATARAPPASESRTAMRSTA